MSVSIRASPQCDGEERRAGTTARRVCEVGRPRLQFDRYQSRVRIAVVFSRLAFVLLVGDLLEPFDWLPVERLLDRDVSHRRGRRSPVPVLLVRSNRDDVAWSDLFDRTAPALVKAATEGNDQRTDRAGACASRCARTVRTSRTRAAGLRFRHYDPSLQPLGCLLIATSYDTGRTKTKQPRRMPAHPALAAILAEWKLSGWAAMMGRQPTPDDLIVPMPPEAALRRRSDWTPEGMRNKSYCFEDRERTHPQHRFRFGRLGGPTREPVRSRADEERDALVRSLRKSLNFSYVADPSEFRGRLEICGPTASGREYVRIVNRRTGQFTVIAKPRGAEHLHGRSVLLRRDRDRGLSIQVDREISR